MKLIAKSDVHGTAGILSFGLTGLVLVNGGEILVAEIDGRPDLSTKLQPVIGKPIEFHVHTHLLDNGPHVLTVRAKRPLTGTEHTSIEFTSENDSPLAKQVPRFLMKSGAPTIFSGPCDSSFLPIRQQRNYCLI